MRTRTILPKGIFLLLPRKTFALHTNTNLCQQVPCRRIERIPTSPLVVEINPDLDLLLHNAQPRGLLKRNHVLPPGPAFESTSTRAAPAISFGAPAPAGGGFPVQRSLQFSVQSPLQ
jgi:hypothetical protein